jgi:hypothetical protein
MKFVMVKVTDAPRYESRAYCGSLVKLCGQDSLRQGARVNSSPFLSPFKNVT